MVRKYKKGIVIHKTKKSAEKIARDCKAIELPYKIVKVANGWRVDKAW